MSRTKDYLIRMMNDYPELFWHWDFKSEPAVRLEGPEGKGNNGVHLLSTEHPNYQCDDNQHHEVDENSNDK